MSRIVCRRNEFIEQVTEFLALKVVKMRDQNQQKTKKTYQFLELLSRKSRRHEGQRTLGGGRIERRQERTEATRPRRNRSTQPANERTNDHATTTSEHTTGTRSRKDMKKKTTEK